MVPKGHIPGRAGAGVTFSVQGIPPWAEAGKLNCHKPESIWQAVANLGSAQGQRS